MQKSLAGQVVDLNLSYTPAQEKIFFAQSARFVTIEKGRRFGFTRGAANFCIESLLDGASILWVDTVQPNLQRYFERYFAPVLKQLPKELYDYNKVEKKLSFKTGGVLDLRSAERPENLEGFGYDIIILNEAGIILKDAYLWDNAISPMLLDNPKSRAFIGGVPKGKNRFYDLARRGMTGQKDWVNLQFSSYDNPLINPAEIDRLVDELGGLGCEAVRQEIYGEFLDISSNQLFGLSAIESAFARSGAGYEPDAPEIWGLDVAREGEDKSVLAKRTGLNVYEFKSYAGLSTTELSREIYGEYLRSPNKPRLIFVDSVGIGAGVYDNLISFGLKGVAREAKSSFKALDESRYKNKRAEMYFNLSKVFARLGIVQNEALKRELQFIEYGYDNKERYIIAPKEQIKKNYGASPDFADALALTFYEKERIASTNASAGLNQGGFGW